MALKSDAWDDWVDSKVTQDMDNRFLDTFAQPTRGSVAEVIRLLKSHRGPQDGFSSPCVEEFLVREPSKLENFARTPDTCQIVCVTQKHSYARLNITKEFFEQLIEQYKIFPQIWDFVVPFSFKTKESDIGHAPFRFHIRSKRNNTEQASFECAYGLRYVELNRRSPNPTEQPDHDPWSVRQSAVYQQYDCKMDRIVFILVSPSHVVKDAFMKELEKAARSGKALHSFDLHRILVTLLYSNWREYIRSLEKIMGDQSDRVVLAEVEREDDKLSPLVDFTINFIDRQRLKLMEDKVLDLMIVFESVQNKLSMLIKQCRKNCSGPECLDCHCETTIEELEEQTQEAQVNLNKVKILHKRAQGTADLLSDLLDYENALIAHKNEKALEGLLRETKDENSKMRVLTERSTRDATAVKLLTVITIIYLPITVVANFFSSQLIKVDNITGDISLISGAWWFAAISVPLTVATIALWWWWLRHATMVEERQQISVTNDDTKLRRERRQHKMLRGASDWVKKSISGRKPDFQNRGNASPA